MIDGYSSFYYGFTVVAQPYNGYMNILEGSTEVTIQVPVGTYTLTTMVDAIRNALLTQGTLEYEVLLDRAERKITISADQTFQLLTNSGSNSASSIWSLIGFDQSADKTGASSYVSDSPAGSEYVTQFPLQSYVSDEDFQSTNQSSKNVASDGTTVEVISFGRAKFIEFDMKFITSRTDIAGGNVIRISNTGLEDARDFLRFITQLNEFEFMPDENVPGDFRRCIVESMPSFQDGTGYKLKELFNQNLRDIYETGLIRLRVVE